MAHSAIAVRPTSIDKLKHEDPGAPSTSRHDRLSRYLYFPPETRGLRTQFRDLVINYIYRIAQGLSDGRLESASVSVWSTPEEEDSLTLDLTLTVDADWDFIGKLRHDTLTRVSEWSREWSEEEKEDYGRRIYFAILPSNL